MTPLLTGALSFVLLFLLIFLQVPVGVAMALAGVVASAALIGIGPAMHILPIEIFHSLASPELALVILFILMGNLAGIAGLPGDLYRLAASLIGHRKGGLAVTTVATAAGFGAICGSSVATTATMTRMALPEMRRYEYGEKLAAGSIAAGATLGIIVPPSIVLILYGILTEQAINRLFIAAIIPALLAVAGYFIAIAWVSWRHPGQAPSHQRAGSGEVQQAGRRSIAFFILALAVGGGLYSGLLTINEAASVGVILSLLIAARRGALTRQALGQSLIETASTTGMIYLVLIGAGVYAYAMTLSGLPGEIVSLIADSGLSPLAIIFLLELMYIVLGSIFDTVAAMVVTLPFVFPLVTSLGYDPIWWGIINVMVMEIGMITPPIGLNVFVLHGMVPSLSLRTIYSGIVPFLVMDLLRLAALTLIPTAMIIL